MLSPHAGRGESYIASADLPFPVAEGGASQHSAPPLSSDGSPHLSRRPRYGNIGRKGLG